MSLYRKDQAVKARQARQNKCTEKKPFYQLDSIQLSRILLFFGFSFLIILICFVGQFPTGLQVLPNQIAKFRIVAEAPFSYPSKVLTDRRNETLKHQITPVFKINEKPFEKIKTDLTDLIGQLNKLFEEIKELPKQEQILRLESISKDYETKSGSYVAPEDFLQILTKTSPAKRQQILNEGLIILKDLLRDGIYRPLENDDNQKNSYFLSTQVEGRKKNSTILSEKEALRYLSLNLSALDIEWVLARTFFRILKPGAQPNLIYDQEQSEKKIADTLATLDPVVVHVKAGESIIEPGTLVGPEQMEKTRAYHEFINHSEDTSFGYNVTLRERSIMTLVILFTALLYIRVSLPKDLKSNRRLLLSALLLVANLGIIRLVLELGDTQLLGSNPIVVATLPFIAPIALAPIMMSIIVGPRLALLTAILVATFYALMLGSITDFLLIAFLASLVGIYFSKGIRVRNQAVKAGTASGITIIITAFSLGVFNQAPWNVIGFQVLFALITGVTTGLLVIGGLPYLEKLFQFTTNISFLELSDFNHPLLRRLQLEAPGTYHHSLMVANLSERAASEIGANPLICRVCSLFHDVGKTVKPDYFVENQREGINPHSDRNPSMSALIIKSHVKEGVALAHQYKLPKLIIDVIEQHHGTTLIKYFYEKALHKDIQRELPLEGISGQENTDDEQNVDESTFRYDGPKPQFKESAIIAIADSVEAASRTLKKANATKIEELVNSIVQEKLEDGQLDDCPLTFKELQIIKKTLVVSLINMLHSRIDYPGKDKHNSNHEKSSSLHQ